MNPLNKPLDIHRYAESLFMGAANRPKACPDCLAANGGYRDTELCAGCYADRYAESPDESDHGDEA